MPAKLNIGLSRKIGESNYGSRGASVNLEVELDAASIQDPQLLQDRVRALYALARQSVEEELERSASSTQNNEVYSGGNGHAHAPSHSQGHGPQNGNGASAPSKAGTATQSQIRAIFAIARRQGLDPKALVQRRFSVGRIDDLTIREASSMIDELKRDSGDVRS